MTDPQRQGGWQKSLDKLHFIAGLLLEDGIVLAATIRANMQEHSYYPPAQSEFRAAPPAG
ncbi:MAG: hypothetical protein HKO62_11460 [Gammaproteobacteria bacterium]|nr:hypothetical protein [Gammaproteobacteria bacterium]